MAKSNIRLIVKSSSFIYKGVQYKKGAIMTVTKEEVRQLLAKKSNAVTLDKKRILDDDDKDETVLVDTDTLTEEDLVGKDKKELRAIAKKLKIKLNGFDKEDVIIKKISEVL